MSAKEEYVLQQVLVTRPKKKDDLLAGIRAGIPIAVGYIPIAVAFGLLAKAANIPNYISLLMSLSIYAGASQFVGINLLMMGAGFSEIIFTTFILNLRHFLMSASLYQRVEKSTSKGLLTVLSYGITDETFTMASLQKQRELSGYFLLALNSIAFFAWNAGTAIGIFLAEGLPESLKSSMGIALYAMFIALLVPPLSKSRPILVVSSAAAGCHGILHWVPWLSGLSSGWAIIISTIIGAFVGSYFYPQGVETNEK